MKEGILDIQELSGRKPDNFKVRRDTQDPRGAIRSGFILSNYSDLEIRFGFLLVNKVKKIGAAAPPDGRGIFSGYKGNVHGHRFEWNYINSLQSCSRVLACVAQSNMVTMVCRAF